MNARAADLIEQSLALLAERVGDPTEAVYARLYAEFPETRERFWRDVSGAIKAEMLTMVVNCLTDPGGPYQLNLIRAERVNHDGFGTAGEVFDRFFWIVMEVCRELSGPDWSAEIEGAWRERLEQVIRTST